MKKLLKLLPAFLIAFAGMAMVSCDDDDDPIAPTELPASAKIFLDTYYPGVKITSATENDYEYQVDLANGHEVDFNLDGEWTEVDAPMGETVPDGFYPTEIQFYVASLPDAIGINEISKTYYGYEVELVSGTELQFNTTGNIINGSSY